MSKYQYCRHFAVLLPPSQVVAFSGLTFGLPVLCVLYTLRYTMDFDAIRPTISGLVGGLIAIWLSYAWARWIPVSCGSKSPKTLKREYGSRVFIANGLCGFGMFAALGFYVFGYFPNNDWRGLGIGVGLMAGLPIAFMFLSTFYRGMISTKECFVYFAISQKTPPMLLFSVLFLCLLGGSVALAYTIF